VLPGITHWNHPAFFAYFAISGSAPGIMGEMLAAALNVNGMLWRTSPAVTEIEATVLDWLRQMIGLSGAFDGIMYDTASISTLVAIAAAREVTGLEIRQRGMAGRPELSALCLYCSEQAHSSVEKAAIALGIGQDGVRKIGTDEAFRMDVDELRRAISRDIDAGVRPFCVVAAAGTTSTTSVDPIADIAGVCEDHGLWLHIDAAYAGVAAILPEKRWVLDGVDRADSLVVNPHKWLFTPIECSCFYSRRLGAVRDAFSLVPEYLRTTEGGEVRNLMDYGPQLGHRFRGLKLWFVMRAYGRAGLEARIREHIRLAQLFTAWVEQAPAWELMAPALFSTVCFRVHPNGLPQDRLDALNREIMDAVNASGEAYLSHTVLHGAFVLRLSIGNIRTQQRHVERAWELLQRAAHVQMEESEESREDTDERSKSKDRAARLPSPS